MDKLEITGGARIGMANATWPMATLTVTKERLELNASVVGNLVFQPKDIISLHTYMKIPLFGQGIKINHRVANYKNHVVFWTFKDPATVIEQINQIGFLENTEGEISDKDALILQQQTGGFPIKKSVAIIAIVLWNVLFISDFINHSMSGKQGLPLGMGANIAIASLLVASVLGLISKDFRKLILKKGKSFKDINKFLYLLVIISGSLLLGRLTF